MKLFTAGASGANLNIPGLPPKTARNIRQLLETPRCLTVLGGNTPRVADPDWVASPGAGALDVARLRGFYFQGDRDARF